VEKVTRAVELQRIDEEDALMSMALTDSEIVQRVRAGDHALFEILMRRHNQRVYRTARAVVKDEAEVEDVMQQAYINAFTHLHQFEDRSEFSTWLTRIALNEAFARRQKMQRTESLAIRAGDHSGALMEQITSTQPDPERQAYAQELGRVLEHAVDELPESYRTVFMLRDVEGLSTSETGAGLGIGDEAVKTRLHRARAMIRRSVSARLGEVSDSVFQFYAPRCDRVVAAVLESIQVGSIATQPESGGRTFQASALP
jgi:RNA polymerase sigma-70 factor, ECF subfamily